MIEDQNRRSILGSIGGLIGVRTIGTSSAFAEDDTAPGKRASLKAMSFNIHNGIGSDGVYDLKRISEVIESVDPDVVALQEVHDQYRAHWEDESPTDYDAQHKLLADWLDMNHVAVGAVRDYRESEDNASWTEEELEKGYRRRSLNVILSKHPILEETVYTYDDQVRWDPPHQDVQSRILLETQLNVEGSHIWFYNTHLHSDQGSDILAGQARELVDIADKRDGTKILAGDFNFLDGRDQYQIVADEYTDLLKEIGEDDETYPAGSNPSWGPLRLDYIFGSEEVEIEDGRRVSYESEMTPSDHFPVVADVTVPRGNQGEDQ